MLKNLKNNLKDNKGFSLVELIVVIAIMVILIALLIPSVSGYIKKANDTSALSAARTVYDAGVQYQADMAAVGKTISADITETTAVDSDVDKNNVDFKTKYLSNLKAADTFKIEINTDGTIKVANFYPGGSTTSDTDGVDGTPSDGYQYPTTK